MDQRSVSGSLQGCIRQNAVKGELISTCVIPLSRPSHRFSGFICEYSQDISVLKAFIFLKPLKWPSILAQHYQAAQ